MAYKIIQKKRFLNKVTSLLYYLETHWNYDVASDFLKILDIKLGQLSNYPFIGTSSQKIFGIRGLFITKHNTLYYRIENKKIVVINMIDTRMNPKKNPYK